LGGSHPTHIIESALLASTVMSMPPGPEPPTEASRFDEPPPPPAPPVPVPVVMVPPVVVGLRICAESSLEQPAAKANETPSSNSIDVEPNRIGLSFVSS